MPKRALIILAEGFEEIEAATPIDILRRAGVEVTVAGLSGTSVKGSRGLTVAAEKKLSDAGADFDALILPGGMPGASNLAASQQVTSLIKSFHQSGKVVAAICASPALVLAPAGVLKNKSATCYPEMEKAFGGDTKFKPESVVTDGNVITSRGPATALAFSLVIAEKLLGRDTEEKVRAAVLA